MKIFRAARGQGKTKWLVERIIEHEAEGKEMYYIGSVPSYERVVCLYQSTMHKRCPLINMTDKTPHWNAADEYFFTDNLMDNLRAVASFAPIIREYSCTWYVTMDKEDFVD
jgi:hypothetical protein